MNHMVQMSGRRLALAGCMIWLGAVGASAQTRPAATGSVIGEMPPPRIIAPALPDEGEPAPVSRPVRPKPSAKVPTIKAPAAATLINARGVTLTGASIMDGEGRAVANLSKPLFTGKSVRLPLKAARGCTYQIQATFEDDSEASTDAVDLCRDARIRLTE